jgi:hypothetical protein
MVEWSIASRGHEQGTDNAWRDYAAKPDMVAAAQRFEEVWSGLSEADERGYAMPWDDKETALRKNQEAHSHLFGRDLLGGQG